MRIAIAAAVVAAGLGGGLSPAGAQSDYESLPEGEGRDLVYGICSGCHSIKLVTQQGMPRKKWDSTLEWMVEKQGMPELDPDTESQILDYLAEHFGTDRRGGQTGTGLSPYNRVQPLQPAQ